MLAIIDYAYFLIAVISELIINPIRHLFKIGYCKTFKRLDGQIALISDGNSSIGKATAIRLAMSGAKVVLACSDMVQGERTYYEIKWKVANATLALMYLDLSSFKSVRNFANKIKHQFEKIDILVNCADVSSCPYIRTEDDFEVHFATNYLSHFLLTMLLLDSLKRSECGKVINVSSMYHLRKYALQESIVNFRYNRSVGKMHFDDIALKNNYRVSTAYNQSKLAQVLFTKELAKRCSSVSAFAIDPGFVSSVGSISLHKLLGNFQFCSAIKFCLQTVYFRTPYQASQTIFQCIFDESVERYSGKYFRDCKPWHSSTFVNDEQISKLLWARSWTFVKLTAKSDSLLNLNIKEDVLKF